MENISSFLTSIEKWGVPKFELFMTVDLYENKNIVQVIDCIFAVSRNAAKLGYQGPTLGPKLAESRTINFTPEQLAEAKNVGSLARTHVRILLICYSYHRRLFPFNTDMLEARIRAGSLSEV